MWVEEVIFMPLTASLFVSSEDIAGIVASRCGDFQ